MLLSISVILLLKFCRFNFFCERATPKSKAFNVCAVHRDKKDGIQVETLEVVKVQSFKIVSSIDQDRFEFICVEVPAPQLEIR